MCPDQKQRGLQVSASHNPNAEQIASQCSVLKCAHRLRDQRYSSRQLEQRISHDLASFASVHNLLPRYVQMLSLRSQGSDDSPLLAGTPPHRRKTPLTQSRIRSWAQCQVVKADGCHEHMRYSPDLRLRHLCLDTGRTNTSARKHINTRGQ